MKVVCIKDYKKEYKRLNGSIDIISLKKDDICDAAISNPNPESGMSYINYMKTVYHIYFKGVYCELINRDYFMTLAEFRELRINSILNG
jgi:hypothetical protein